MAPLFVIWLHLCLLSSNFVRALLDPNPTSTQDSDLLDSPVDKVADSSPQDMATLHMFKMYDKYNMELNRPRDGNTVRSFKATQEAAEQKLFYKFNLTSVQESEVILSTMLHFYDKQPRSRPWLCKRLKSASCRGGRLPSFHLLFRHGSSADVAEPLLGNVSFVLHRRGVWQSRDISLVIKEAREKGTLVFTVEFDFGEKYQKYHRRLPSSSLPYMLVYANDLAISEPNSMAATLQRYDPLPGGDDVPSPYREARVKRDAYIREQIQTNELPEVEYEGFKKHDAWDSTYLPLKPKAAKKERRRKGQNADGSKNSQVLSFDEKTMKKARQRQWTEPRGCARRYLKVDFADIGWSEWILSPKSFDAYYCSGTCDFPMHKVVRPSNHATIQSIVKAVGIIPGIPEPCCVPDKMSPLSVLFLDESRNMVLKVYPNMAVQSCACR